MPKHCIARVWNQSHDGVVGTAFLVTPKHLLTCAHVVNYALSRKEMEADPPDVEFQIDFPADPKKRKLNVCVIKNYWYPRKQNQPAISDIAVLELLDPLLENCHAGTLININNDSTGSIFRVFGFPGQKWNGQWGPGDQHGRWAKGQISGALPDNQWLQAEALSNGIGEQIQPGFSGAPVWNKDKQAIIGMIIAYDKELKKRQGFILPTRVLLQAWPDLETLGDFYVPSSCLFTPLELDELRILLAAISLPNNKIVPLLKKLAPHSPEAPSAFDKNPLAGAALLLAKTNLHTTNHPPLFEFFEMLWKELSLNATGHQLKELEEWRKETAERLGVNLTAVACSVNADRHFELAYRSYRQENWQNAYDDFEKALQLNFSHYKANFYFGRTLIKVGQLSKAYKILKKTYDLDPVESKQQQFSDAWIELVEKFLLENKLEEALQACDEALRMLSSDIIKKTKKNLLFIKQGDDYFSKNNYRDALISYSKSDYCKNRLEKFKNISNEEWMTIGNGAIKKEALKAASIAYECAGENEIAAVVKKNPNMPDVYFSLAEYYINKKKFKQVKRYLYEIKKSKHKKSNILLSSFICKQISSIEKKKYYYLSDNNDLLNMYAEILAIGKEFKITFSQEEIEKMKEIKYENYKNKIIKEIDKIKRNDLLNDDSYFLRELTEYLNEWQYKIINSSKPNKNTSIIKPNKLSSPKISKKLKETLIRSNGYPVFIIKTTNNQLNIYCKNDKIINLIKIAPGKVFLGKNNDIFNSKQEVVNLNYSYWIGKYPITNEQFSLYKKDHIFDIDDRLKPVVNISWKTALMYCDWLQNEVNIDNEKKFIIRLPNEAEWERAAKGETTNIYPWGNDPISDELCNYDMINRGLTDVDKYSPKGESHPFGCCDMSGNVWEWTISLYSDKKIDNAGNNFSRKIIQGNRYVCKGGAWNFPKQHVTCASRYKFLPNTAKDNIGYRILIIRY